MKKFFPILAVLGLLVLPAISINAQFNGFIPGGSNTCVSRGTQVGVCEANEGEDFNTCPRDCPPAPKKDVFVVLDRALNFAFAILLVFAGIFIVIAAYYFVSAAGDATKVSTARNFVLYALIGVLVAFLARGLVALVGRIAG